MIKLFKYIRKRDWLLIIIAIGLIYGQVWLDLKLPEYMSEITRLIETEGSKMSEILKQGGFMLGCAMLSLISAFIVGYIAALVSSGFSRTLRSKVFNKVESFSLKEMKKFHTSSLITRTTNDVTQMEMLIGMGMQMIIKAPIMAVRAVSKILDKSIELSMVTGVGVVILLVVIGIIMIIVVPRFSKIQKLIDGINGVTEENLTGVRVIRAFNAEKFIQKRFNKINSALTNNMLFNQRAFAFLMPVMNIVMNFLALLIYFIGASLIANATIGDKIGIFSNVVVFSSYGMQVIISFLMLAIIFMIIPRAEVSAKRIYEVLKEKNSIKDGKFNKDTEIKGEVEFKNVSFKYPDADEYLLKDISFKVSKGETIAFIGSTGSGKSSLINLIPRFYDATEGEVLVDGINVKDYKLSNLYDKLGYISQKAFMFNGTVKSNVSYGKKISNEKIEEAIKVAQADEFVSKMEKGIDSKIARGGSNVSGGQKQRLSIARAVAKNPEIYIFDDSFSALDYKTDRNLRKELKKYTKDSTSLIVAQRIGTIMNADKIIVLDKGRVVGEGTHKELLKSCEVYKEIALSQLSKEELENA